MRLIVGVAMCLLAGCVAVNPTERQIADLQRILRLQSRHAMQARAERFFPVGAPAAEFQTVWAEATDKEVDATAHETLYHFFPASEGEEGDLGIAVVVDTRSNTVSEVMVDELHQ